MQHLGGILDQLERLAAYEGPWRPLRDETGRIFGVFGCYEDITERKRAEAELLRFKSILDATTDLVGIAEADGRMLYVNRAGRRFMGVGDEEDLAAIDWRVFQPESAEEPRKPGVARLGDQAIVYVNDAPLAMLHIGGRGLAVRCRLAGHPGRSAATGRAQAAARDDHGGRTR